MSYKVITISREFGSGGRTVGKQLAEKLGVPCYDREIVEKVALESGYDKKYIEIQSCRSSVHFRVKAIYYVQLWYIDIAL